MYFSQEFHFIYVCVLATKFYFLNCYIPRHLYVKWFLIFPIRTLYSNHPRHPPLLPLSNIYSYSHNSDKRHHIPLRLPQNAWLKSHISSSFYLTLFCFRLTTPDTHATQICCHEPTYMLTDCVFICCRDEAVVFVSKRWRPCFTQRPRPIRSASNSLSLSLAPFSSTSKAECSLYKFRKRIHSFKDAFLATILYSSWIYLSHLLQVYSVSCCFKIIPFLVVEDPFVVVLFDSPFLELMNSSDVSLEEFRF